jgi:hypothetical protein
MVIEEVFEVEGTLALAGAGGSGDDGTPSKPRLDRKIQIRLGDQLRTMYDGLMMEPVPAHLLAIIEGHGKAET